MMVSPYGEYAMWRAPLFPFGMMLTIVYLSMAQESR